MLIRLKPPSLQAVAADVNGALNLCSSPVYQNHKRGLYTCAVDHALGCTLAHLLYSTMLRIEPSGVTHVLGNNAHCPDVSLAIKMAVQASHYLRPLAQAED